MLPLVLALEVWRRAGAAAGSVVGAADLFVLAVNLSFFLLVFFGVFMFFLSFSAFALCQFPGVVSGHAPLLLIEYPLRHPIFVNVLVRDYLVSQRIVSVQS
jgi:hypothetical protein